MIRTEDLTKDYGTGRGIHGLTLHVPKGTIFGYIGPNGSGKTTTIKMLCGLANPTRGTAKINGLLVNRSNTRKIKSIIGYLPDHFGVYDQMTVWEYLDFFGAAYKIGTKVRRKRIEEVAELIEATHMLDYQVASLSHGMHQKAGIAKTLLHDPELLILDEPANGLDPHARIDMRNTILRLKSIGKTIMLSSHILPELGAICDHVAILEKGRLLIHGTVAEISSKLKENIALDIVIDGDTEAAAKILKAEKSIKSVNVSGHELDVEYTGKRAGVADLNAKLIKEGVRVLSFSEAKVDLENVFLAVTGKKDGPVVKASDPV